MYTPNQFGSTILHEAIDANYAKAVRFLVSQYPVDLNDERLGKPRPPLHMACGKGAPSIDKQYPSTYYTIYYLK